MPNSTPVQGFDFDYWRHELEAVEAALKLVMQRRDAIRRMILAAEELGGLQSRAAPDQQRLIDVPANGAALGPAAPQGFLRGREAIKAVLSERGQEMEQRQIYRTMAEKNWIEPGLKDAFSSVRVTLRRMASKGEIRKIRDGVYAPLPQETGDE